jgi:biopolymer transport protein ExbB
MDIVRSMLALFLATGAAWIMWLLIVLSVLSVALMLERAFVLRRKSRGVEELGDQIMAELRRGEISKVLLRLELMQSAPAQVALWALRSRDKGPEAMAEAAKAARAQQRTELEERLGFLGSLGSNAPFIGLLGTVVGIIKAFHDLALSNSGGGARVVMAGISEALVATAMGLFVAIPAVLAFNYFQRRIRTLLASADALVHRILAELRPELSTHPARPESGDGAPADRQTQLRLGGVAP